jgi:hypothetical protein
VFLQVMTKPFYLFIFNCNHRCKRDGWLKLFDYIGFRLDISID